MCCFQKWFDSVRHLCVFPLPNRPSVQGSVQRPGRQSVQLAPGPGGRRAKPPTRKRETCWLLLSGHDTHPPYPIPILCKSQNRDLTFS